jgi:hypothetical protein
MDFAQEAPNAVIWISEAGLKRRLVEAQNIRRAGFDTGPAAGTAIRIDVNRHH